MDFLLLKQFVLDRDQKLDSALKTTTRVVRILVNLCWLNMQIQWLVYFLPLLLLLLLETNNLVTEMIAIDLIQIH